MQEQVTLLGMVYTWHGACSMCVHRAIWKIVSPENSAYQTFTNNYEINHSIRCETKHAFEGRFDFRIDCDNIAGALRRARICGRSFEDPWGERESRILTK